MNRYDKLLKKLASKDKVIGTTMIQLVQPFLLEKMFHDDLDFILMDAEHGCFDTQNVIPMLRTCRLMGMPAFMRVQDSQYHLIAKAIDMGADGVMIPRVETLEQLRIIADSVYFAPLGRKGAGGAGQFRNGESFDSFQKSRMVFIQIESAVGIDNLPAMLEQYGEMISAVIIGPNDLSVMLGTPMDSRSAVSQAAIQKVFDICKHYGKSCGIFCNDAADAGHYRAMGANVLWTASDIQFYMRGYMETLTELQTVE